MNPFNYSQAKLNQIFSDVKVLYRDDVEEVIKEYMLRGLKKLLEGAMKAEVIGYLRARNYERTDERVDYRNGYRYRDLRTAFGLIERLRVPRTQRGGYQPGVFKRYQRRWAQVNQFIRDIFINGVSTRNVGVMLELLAGYRVSASTVSEVNKVLDAEVGAFHRRVLSDEYVYLFLDGVRQRVVSCGRVVSKVVLVVYGVRVDGHREVVDFRVARNESETEWFGFLNSLYQRGLAGRGVRLVITDGGKGLLAALDMVYPGIKRQRCWVHKLRNVAKYIPRRYQKECLGEAKGIYGASNYREAVRRYKGWCQKWRGVVPKAVACLERDIEDLLVFIQEDKKLWRKLRTTNAIERLFKELRRRTRPMSLFANVASCERIIFSLFNKYNKKWKEHRYVVFK